MNYSKLFIPTFIMLGIVMTIIVQVQIIQVTQGWQYIWNLINLGVFAFMGWIVIYSKL